MPQLLWEMEKRFGHGWGSGDDINCKICHNHLGANRKDTLLDGQRTFEELSINSCRPQLGFHFTKKESMPELLESGYKELVRKI